MVWTAPRTWIAGEVPTAAIMNLHIRDNLRALNGYVRKTVNESLATSTALQNDDQLSYAIPAAGAYEFDLYLLVSATANGASSGDLKVGFTFPTGTLIVGALGADTNLAAGATVATLAAMSNQSIASGADFAFFGASTTPTFAWVHGLLIASASGTLQVQWAQAINQAAATSVLAGSHLRVRQAA